MYVYLRINSHVSSIILTSFRQGSNFNCYRDVLFDRTYDKPLFIYASFDGIAN